MMKKIIFCLSIISTLLINVGCNPDNSKGSVNQEKPLNITILLDLSDRLVQPNVNPGQETRDTAIINYIVGKFKSHALAGGKLLTSKDHLKVMFYPDPKIQQINVIAKNLDVNLAKLQPAEKKKKLMKMDSVFAESLDMIYTSTKKNQNWVGCDIWGFFSDKKVDHFCMADSSRNIVFVLTDGYLYHKNNMLEVDNQYSYILPQTLKVPNSKLMVKRDGLENLEVLMLEINPKDPSHLNKIQTIIGEWLEGMGVQQGKYQVVETDMPNNIEDVIDYFLGF